MTPKHEPRLKHYWLVGLLHKNIEVLVGTPWGEQLKEMPFSTFADGVVGACYAFRTKRDAQKFGGKKAVLMRMTVMESDAAKAEKP